MYTHRRPDNLALGKAARQSSIYCGSSADTAVNGDASGDGQRVCTCTQQDPQAWWEVSICRILLYSYITLTVQWLLVLLQVMVLVCERYTACSAMYIMSIYAKRLQVLPAHNTLDSSSFSRQSISAHYTYQIDRL
jgi:hypothetical protein